MAKFQWEASGRGGEIKEGEKSGNILSARNATGLAAGDERCGVGKAGGRRGRGGGGQRGDGA